MRLRDYEREWLARVRRSTARRVLIVGPTGCGKTVVASHLMRERVRAREPVLFVVHRRELVLQAVQRLREVGVAARDIGVNVGNAQALGLTARPGALVQVVSVQTLAKREPSQWPAAKLVIVDEAHHAPAPSYQAVLEHYGDAQRYGLTATPYRMDGAPLGTLFDEIVQSAPPSSLVEAGWIVKPAVYTVPESQRADLADVRINSGSFGKGDYDQRELACAVNRPHLVGSILEHWQRHALGRAAVCFAVNVEHGEHITRAFQGHGVAAELVTGDTPPRERADVLARVRAGATRVIVNCAVFTEGWDAPEVKLAIIARPTMSRALWFQMAGRITRPHEHTPIVLDHAGNAIVHGLPLEDETFSLHAALERRKRHGNVAEKPCPACGNSVAVGARFCGFCAHEFWSRELPEEETGRLVLAQGGAVFCTYDKCPRPNEPVRGAGIAPAMHRGCQRAATPPRHDTRGRRLLAAVGSAVELRRRLGTESNALVYNWLNGERIPNTTGRAKLAREFGVPVAAWDQAPDGTPIPGRDEMCTYAKCPRPDEPIRGRGRHRTHLDCKAAIRKAARTCQYTACDQPDRPLNESARRLGTTMHHRCWARHHRRERAVTGPYDSRGRQLLLEIDESAFAFARRFGMKAGIIRSWCSGRNRPGAVARALLDRELGIPASAWKEAPEPAPRAARMALIRTVASRRRVGLCAVCVCAPCVCARPPLEQCLGG